MVATITTMIGEHKFEDIMSGFCSGVVLCISEVCGWVRQGNLGATYAGGFCSQ